MNSRIMRAFVTIVSIAAISLTGVSAFASEVNVYSARKEALIKPLLDQFNEQTGIKVNLITGDADALIQRLISEGRESPADLLITVDAARLGRAHDVGVLQSIQSDTLTSTIPEHYRDTDGYWFGLSVRTRVIVAAKAIDASSLTSYQDLAKPEWKKRVCIRSSNNIYNQSLVAAMIAHQGIETTEQWARGLVSNLARKPQGGDRDQIKAVAAGQCDIAVVNSYYIGQMTVGSDAEKSAVDQISIIWPNQDGLGAHVNISGAGVTASAKHKAEAIQLLEFLVRKPAQQWYAEQNMEYPIRDDVEKSALLKSWGPFKADSLALQKLGEYNTEAVKLMDRASWR